MIDQFSIDITCHDFKVNPIAFGENFAILAGIRPLFFHFVVITTEGSSNFKHINIHQFHLHKYDLASECLALKEWMGKNQHQDPLGSHRRDELQIRLDTDMSFWVNIDILGFDVRLEQDTAQWFMDALEKEMKRVESSIIYLSKSKNQEELLRKLALPDDEYDFTQTVWRCIQFEQNLFARHKDKLKGISLLYHYMLSFNVKLTQNDVDQISYTLDHFDPLCTCDFCRENAEMFDKVQQRYFPQPVYIRGQQKFSLETIKKNVKKMFSKLEPKDKISLIYLLNVSPMTFMTLAWFSGLKTEQSLIDLLSSDLEPDSNTEQDIRQEVSLIGWFRKIV